MFLISKEPCRLTLFLRNYEIRAFSKISARFNWFVLFFVWAFSEEALASRHFLPQKFAQLSYFCLLCLPSGPFVFLSALGESFWSRLNFTKRVRNSCEPHVLLVFSFHSKMGRSISCLRHSKPTVLHKDDGANLPLRSWEVEAAREQIARIVFFPKLKPFFCHLLVVKVFKKLRNFVRRTSFNWCKNSFRTDEVKKRFFLLESLLLQVSHVRDRGTSFRLYY